MRGNTDNWPPTTDKDEDDLDPDIEEENGEDTEQQVLALPEPPEGMTYTIRTGSDGSQAVCLVPDNGEQELSSVNTGDGRSFSNAKTRSVLRAMNKHAKAAYRTADAAMREQTLFVHYPTQGERMELRQNGGQWRVMLISPTSNILGEIPEGAEDLTGGSDDGEDDDRQSGAGSPRTGLLRAEHSQFRRAGDRRTRQTGDDSYSRPGITLAEMNRLHRAYWATRPR